ncbi:hypothetical protein LCGC14_1840550 [marine sediment metagenome]|uniref:Uncharacterized protein n=1 Tax=marine sediment metagenome TaxID=412755 RepID=A0A0F9GDJ0_9ZZZZ
MNKESELSQMEETKKAENICGCGCGCIGVNTKSVDIESTNKEDTSS